MRGSPKQREAVFGLVDYYANLAAAYSADYGVTVQLGAEASANYQTKVITLPAALNHAQPGMRPVIEGLLDHEAGHMAEEGAFGVGSRPSDVSAELQRIPGVNKRLIQQIWNCLEDGRMERAHGARAPGIEANLELKTDYFMKQLDARKLGSEQEVFLRAIRCAVVGRELPHLAETTVAGLVEAAGSIVRRAAEAWRPTDIGEAARELYSMLEEKAGPPPPPEKGGEGDEGDEAQDDEDIEVDEGEGDEDSEVDEGGGDEAQGDEGEGDEGKGEGEGDEAEGDEGKRVEREAAKAILEATEDVGGLEDDGWRGIELQLGKAIEQNKAYYLPAPSSANLDRVIVPPSNFAAYAAARRDAYAEASGMSRKLALWLRAQVHMDTYGEEAGDLDEDSYVDAVLGDKDVYTSTRPGLFLDTVWSILVDESASMAQPSGRGSKLPYVVARSAAVVLGEALSKCRIPFEMWGWSTKASPIARDRSVGAPYTRTTPNDMYQYKSFDEHWRRVRERCGSISPRCENDDTAAVRFVANRLVQRKENWKILLVLTDGKPNHVASRSTTSHAFARRQLSDVLAQARAAGIHDIGVGILSDHVVGLYTEHAVVWDVSELPAACMAIVRRIVRSGR